MQYISFIKGKGGKKVTDDFRDFIGCQESIDSPGETRALLKAFSDFVESEGMAEQQAREKTETLVDYATSQARIGEPMTSLTARHIRPWVMPLTHIEAM